MNFIPSANLSSYLWSDPRNCRDRLTNFWGDMLISWIMNKWSYQIKVLLYWSSIRVIVEILIISNRNASFLIVSKSPFWYEYTFLRGFFIYGMKSLKNPETMTWSLSLSGEYMSWNWPGKEVRKSKLFLSRVGKGIISSKPWSSIMSSNICPSDWLIMLPDLLSLAGQKISLNLKSPSRWTDGIYFTFTCMLRLNMIKLVLKQLEVFDSPIWLSISTCYMMRRFICEYFLPKLIQSYFPVPWLACERCLYEWVASPRHYEYFYLFCTHCTYKFLGTVQKL